MRRHRELITLLTALVVHGGIGYVLLRTPIPAPRAPRVVEFDVKSPPPSPPPEPALTPPEPVKPPPVEPPRRVVRKQRTAVAPPPNAEPPKEPPPEPPKPVFGVTMDSVTAGDAPFSVPLGNTTMIDPAKSGRSTGPPAPLPAAPPPPSPPAYKPVSARYVKTMPTIDTEQCGRGVPYPKKAQAQGIEGDVILRVSLDETGRVHDVKVLSGLGYGLDEAAVHALKNRCQFTPAISTDGNPVPFVIPSYTFHFELPR
jgi:protein TonB